MKLYSYLELKLLYKYQYNFRHKPSDSHALIELNEYIKMRIDQGDYVCGLFTNLSIEFCTVNHKSLNEKLNYYSTHGISNKRFQLYLTNRL